MEFTAAYFDIRKQNIVVNTPDFQRKTQNGEVRSEGIELLTRSTLTSDLEVTATYTYLDVTVTDNPQDPALEGKTPVWVAEQQASVWANYQLSAAVRLSGGIRHVGESQMDKYNLGTVPAYTLADLAASYELNRTFRLGLTASNLSDKRYVGACYDIDSCWMGAQRSVELNLYASF